MSIEGATSSCSEFVVSMYFRKFFKLMHIYFITSYLCLYFIITAIIYGCCIRISPSRDDNVLLRCIIVISELLTSWMECVCCGHYSRTRTQKYRPVQPGPYVHASKMLRCIEIDRLLYREIIKCGPLLLEPFRTMLTLFS